MRRILLALGLALVAAPAAGQSLADYDYEDLGFRGIGLDVGYVWSDRIQDTELYSLRLDLGYLGPGVRIIPSLSFWSSRITGKELGQLAERINGVARTSLDAADLGPVEWSDLSLSLDGHFVWNTPLHVLTFVGAGLGFHALNGSGPAIDNTFVEDLLDAITAGVAGIAGLEFEPMDRIRAYGEMRYTVMNSIQYLSARAGLQLMFGQGASTEVGSVVAPPPLEPPARTPGEVGR